MSSETQLRFWILDFGFWIPVGNRSPDPENGKNMQVLSDELGLKWSGIVSSPGVNPKSKIQNPKCRASSVFTSQVQASSG
jgi:hypothetical protein